MASISSRIEELEGNLGRLTEYGKISHRGMGAMTHTWEWDLGRLRAEKARKERESAAARRKVDKNLQASAETQAKQVRSAAKQRQKAASEMLKMHKKNLERSQAETREARDRATGRLEPWMQAGLDALGQIQEKIATGPGEFEESPGYQWRLKEGQKAVERGAAARGGALSGRAVKEGLRYGQGFASNEYDKFIDRYYRSFEPLQQLSGQGMQASNQMGQFDTHAARDLANQGLASTTQMASAQKYRGEAGARGTESAAALMAQQQKEEAERHYGYAAWKGGEEF